MPEKPHSEHKKLAESEAIDSDVVRQMQYEVNTIQTLLEIEDLHFNEEELDITRKRISYIRETYLGEHVKHGVGVTASLLELLIQKLEAKLHLV